MSGQPDLRVRESEGSGRKSIGRPWITADPCVIGAAEAIAMMAYEAKNPVEERTAPTDHAASPVEKNWTLIHAPWSRSVYCAELRRGGDS